MASATDAARDASAEEQEHMLYSNGSHMSVDDQQRPAKAATGEDERKDDDGQTRDGAAGLNFPPWMIIITWISLSTAVIFYKLRIRAGNGAVPDMAESDPNPYSRDIMVNRHFKYPITLTTLHLLFQTIGKCFEPNSLHLAHRRADAKISALSSTATRILHRFTDLISGTSTGTSQYTALPMTTSDDRQSSPLTSANTLAGVKPGFSQDEERRRIKDASVNMSFDDWKLQILPPAVMFSASLCLSNWAYLYLSTAYIQMLKAFGPVAYLLAAFALGTKAFSLKLLGIVLVISSGVGMASYGEANFNLTGFLIQATAIAIEATRVTLIQILLQSGGGMSPLKTLYCTSKTIVLGSAKTILPILRFVLISPDPVFAPVCFCVNAALIIPFEGFAALTAIPRLGLFTILSNCTLTFLLNLSGVYLISLSSMVLSLTKVVKDILLVAGSALILGDALTLFQCFAYGVSTVGLFWYKTSS
ncbi:hypothetical protein OIV83_001067 [Microbotryomycetes sp. JL201]|nr:hypothetical protein OIV83_001067 [Microbotryomycetes sp. JL201]